MDFECIETLNHMPRRSFKALLSAVSSCPEYSRISVRGAANADEAQKRILARVFNSHGITVGRPEDENFDLVLDAAVNAFNRRAAQHR